MLMREAMLPGSLVGLQIGLLYILKAHGPPTVLLAYSPVGSVD